VLQSNKLSSIRLSTLFFSSPAAGSAFRFHFQHPNFLYPTCFPVFATIRFYAKSRRKMPPKKAVKEEKLLLGRPGNNLKSGIVR
jgi:hypothetical protein